MLRFKFALQMRIYIYIRVFFISPAYRFTMRLYLPRSFYGSSFMATF